MNTQRLPARIAPDPRPAARRVLVRLAAAAMLSLALPGAVAAATTSEPALPFPVVTRFESFHEADGLPAHKIHCVLKASDGRLWLGTAEGLCVREADGRFHTYGRAEGLSHPTVLSIAEDPATGDLWLATMQGLTRFSGGRCTVFTQTNSGLPNNVVYAVAVAGDTVWAATAAGAGAYDTKARSWRIYDQNNTVMEEPWCYAIAPAENRIFIGVWAGGVVEHDPKTGSFKAYRDPDGDFQLQLQADAGPVADITSWLAYDAGIVWQATYFGLARYDTHEATWRTWVQDKSPLVSNFINSVYARGRIAWVATDRGVSVTDGTTWLNYIVDEKGVGAVRTFRPGQAPETRTMTTALADGFVMAVWADEHEAWFATSNGLSRGTFADAREVAANP